MTPELVKAIIARYDAGTATEDELCIVRDLAIDGMRFRHLQNIPVKDAQAFFWNYSSRKQRGAAIDAAMRKER